jgi:hypothetical protein
MYSLLRQVVELDPSKMKEQITIWEDFGRDVPVSQLVWRWEQSGEEHQDDGGSYDSSSSEPAIRAPLAAAKSASGRSAAPAKGRAARPIAVRQLEAPPADAISQALAAERRRQLAIMARLTGTLTREPMSAVDVTDEDDGASEGEEQALDEAEDDVENSGLAEEAGEATVDSEDQAVDLAQALLEQEAELAEAEEEAAAEAELDQQEASWEQQAAFEEGEQELAAVAAEAELEAAADMGEAEVEGAAPEVPHQDEEASELSSSNLSGTTMRSRALSVCFVVRFRRPRLGGRCSRGRASLC